MAQQGSLKTSRLKRYLKSKRVIAGIVVILSISIVVIYPEIIPWYSNNELDWNVQSGDRLTYIVTYTNTSPIDEQWNPYAMVELVGVEVVFEIISLPTIPRVVRPDNFLQEVIFPDKTTCYFANGSSLPLSYTSHLTNLISNCILPVNGSYLLDSLYSDSNFNLDTTGDLEGEYYYFQEIDTNSTNMLIGYKSFWYYEYGHGGEGTIWYGEFSKETGIPHYLALAYYAPMSTGCLESERVTLSLISFES